MLAIAEVSLDQGMNASMEFFIQRSKERMVD